MNDYLAGYVYEIISIQIFLTPSAHSFANGRFEINLEQKKAKIKNQNVYRYYPVHHK